MNPVPVLHWNQEIMRFLLLKYILKKKSFGHPCSSQITICLSPLWSASFSLAIRKISQSQQK